uniref:Secreted protein n=1 Tax=Wuchereria bancrofti TaxID=6293 RepID=A0AAF5Q1J6_WUCBA
MLIKIAILLITFEQSLPQPTDNCCCPRTQARSSLLFPFLPDYSWLLPHPTYGEEKKECGGCCCGCCKCGGK